MQRKKMTLRFDLDYPEDRRAWEYLQSLNATSMNKTVLSIRLGRTRRCHSADNQVLRTIYMDIRCVALKKTLTEQIAKLVDAG